MQKLSIIIPFYNEEGNIVPLYQKLKKSISIDFKDFDYEIIMVND
jgi:glycosyltransferase involved in cell wall biosynthesis